MVSYTTCLNCVSHNRDALRLVRLKREDEEGEPAGEAASPPLPEYGVSASSFMAFHSILRNSRDYTEALRWSRRLVDSLSESLARNLTRQRRPDAVFGYSVFYVFYEQYLTMWRDALESLLVSLLAIFGVTFVLMGFDVASSCVILLVITMILVNMLGLMFWWDIQLNAISLVNLVMAVGISVEFCSHLTRAFSICVAENKVARARTTLVTMGSSVSWESKDLEKKERRGRAYASITNVAACVVTCKRCLASCCSRQRMLFFFQEL